MELSTHIEDSKATIEVVGKLSVATAPDLESIITGLDEAVKDFDIDLSGLEYISSAGLRVLVSTQKLALQRGGSMRLLHPIDDVMEVFEMTGLADVMEIER